METVHESVLLDEVLAMSGLTERTSPSLVFDATLGGGGHSEALLKRFPQLFLLGCDQDENALERTRRRLAPFSERICLFHGNFSELEHHLENVPKDLLQKVGREEPALDALLIDLGISSDQLDDPERGFSFRFEGPLDMRMDRSQGESAADLLNTLSQQQIERLFLRGGVSQPLPRRLAKAILESRPITTTSQFAEICRKVTPPQYGKERFKDAATVPFQALRIAVNREYDVIEEVLPQALTALAPGGRMLIISFHSLEDKAVAHTMRAWTREGELPPGVPVRGKHQGLGSLLTPQAVVPGEEEIGRNPRARSARMRVFEKLHTGASGK